MAEKKTVRQTKPWIQGKVWLDFTPAAARKNLSTTASEYRVNKHLQHVRVNKPAQSVRVNKPAHIELGLTNLHNVLGLTNLYTACTG
jgi:hypothetical protein